MPNVIDNRTLQSKLPELKDCTKAWYDFFKDNYEIFNKTRTFVFRSNLTAGDISTLESLKKPKVEFNILPAFVARLRGEFAKQEPSLEVRGAANSKVDPATINLVESHVRSILFASDLKNSSYNIYTDLLTGGFSALKVWTDYENSKSFQQNIYWDRVYDPCLTIFDPLARLSHKGDGMYCGELFPMRKIDFEKRYPDVNLGNINFIRAAGDFRWSYNNQKEDIIVMCDFYEKKRRKSKIVMLANGQTMEEKQYKEYVKKWDENGHIAQPAQVVRKRTTEIEVIMRYRFIENQIIEEEETDYTMLPIVFVDGDSLLLRDSTESAVNQFVRPYVYNAIGTQRLKNFAGQCLANELENMVQHKWLIAKEAIPVDYIQAYKQPQLPSVVVYNAYNNNDASQQLPPPREVQRPPIPQEITSTFAMCDPLTQTILGSYDASLGINDNQLSGTAIIEGATQSNATAMPYVVGFLHAMTQLGQIIVSLIPKYYVTPRTIPVVGKDGKHSYVAINPQGQMTFDYDEDALQVEVKAGVNFQLQKSRSLSQMFTGMQASQTFAQFMNSKCMDIMLDNMEFRGQDIAKERAQDFMQQMQQSQGQPNPLQQKMQLESQKLQMQAQQNQADNQFRGAEIANDSQATMNDRMKIMLEAHQSQADNAVQLKKADVEEFSHAANLALAASDQAHRHMHDKAKFEHELVKTALPDEQMKLPSETL